MSRPAGVTATAVVSIIGSVVLLLVAVGMVLSGVSSQVQAQVPHMVALLSAMAAVFAGFAALGVWTAIGLLRLRSWARTSILVFAGFLAAVSVMSGVTMAIVPLPSGLDPGATAMIRPLMVGMYAAAFAIGIWWLVQFNTKATRDAFAAVALPGEAPRRPLSISIIGWSGVIGGVMFVIPAALRMPAFVAGTIVTGWGAMLIYALFAALNVYLGRGLLALRERSRVLAIAYYGLLMLYAVAMVSVPGLYARMEEYQRTFLLPGETQPPFELVGSWLRTVQLVSLVVLAVPIWYLVRRRGVFAR